MKLREISEPPGTDTEIIFLTSSPEYAVDSYEVKAQNYLLKPVTEEKFLPP